MAKQDVELQFKLIDGVSKGLASIQQGVNGLGASLVKINAAAELTGKAFGAISSVAGAFGDAITGAASVEDALTRVNTITRATVEEQKALQDAVRGAVEGTRFSAEEAAGALVLLAEDGFSAKEAVDQLGSVLQFAQANAQSAATAAGALGAVLDTFGEKPQLIGALADKLTAVAVGAGVSTKALQEGLAGVGNAADQAGLSLDETIGYLGLLASRGIEGGAAVNRFNLIIRDLADPASKAGKEIKALGLDASDFAGILNRLGNDSVAAEKVLSALGKKPREALRVLLQEGGGDLGRFKQILEESAGASKAASDALNENFAGALERVQNQLELARNDFLTPLLAPLAAEIEAFRDKVDRFTESRQFDRLRDQLTEFVGAGVRAFGDLIEKADFEVIAERVSSFAASASETFDALVVVVKATAAAIVGIANSIEYVNRVFTDFEEVVAVASFGTSKLRLGAVDAVTAFRMLGAGAEKGGKSTKEFGAEAYKAAEAAWALAPAVADVGAAADNVVREVGAIPEPTKTAADAFDKVNVSAQDAAIGLERLRLSTLVAAQSLLFQAGESSSATFSALTAEIAKTEAKIAALEASTKGATQATEQQIQVVKRLKQELQNLGDQQDNVDQGNKKLAKSNSQVSDSFGNIDRQSSSVAVSLGNMSEAYARLAIEAAGAAKSADEYVAIWNSYVQRFEDIDQQIQKHIDVLRAQNNEMTEEDRIRRLLLVQYGNSSTRIEELVQLKLKQAEATRKANDESEREIQIEERRTQLAGGIGTQSQAQAATGPGASAGRGTVAGAARNDSPINITINQNGATPETIRDLAPLIERELGRLGSLRR